MSFDEFALICTYSVITVLSQAKSGLSFFFDFPDVGLTRRTSSCFTFRYVIFALTIHNYLIIPTASKEKNSVYENISYDTFCMCGNISSTV